jgi:hypothetical protein
VTKLALQVWLAGSQAQAAGVIDMLLGLDAVSKESDSIEVERVDVEGADFRLNPADVERLRARRTCIVMLMTPELAERIAGFEGGMAALCAAAAACEVLVAPVYCRYMPNTECLPCSDLPWLPGKLQPLTALANSDETVRLACQQIVAEVAAFSGNMPAAPAADAKAVPVLAESEPDVAIFCDGDDNDLVAHDMDNILRILKRRGAFRQEYGTWQEAPDGDWSEKRDRARRAPFVVFMVSADLLADDYYWEFISSGLQPHQKVLCVYLRACDHEFAVEETKGRIVPCERGKAFPIAGSRDKDEAWNQVLVALQRLVTGSR